MFREQGPSESDWRKIPFDIDHYVPVVVRSLVGATATLTAQRIYHEYSTLTKKPVGVAMIKLKDKARSNATYTTLQMSCDCMRW
jgi:hypothetical protein